MKDNVTDDQILEAVASSKSMSEAARKLGYKYLGRFCRRAEKLGVWKTNQGGKGNMDRSPEDYFVTGKPSRTAALIYYLKQEREWKCECCGLSEWQGKPLSLELHHVDGNRTNNVRENLQILCPNCHSQTDNWRSRNKKGYSKDSPKVSDKDLLEAVQSEGSILKGLEKLGLAGGANYFRVERLLAKRYLKEGGLV